VIYGERIRFRRVERSDLPTYVRWISEPEVRRGISMIQPMSMVEEENWFENMLKRPTLEHPFAVEIRDGEGWQHIGSVGLFGIDWRSRSAEFGIMLGDKSVWNQGYGTETARLMLKHAFEMLNLNRVWLLVFEFNKGGIRAYEKAGFVHEGTMREREFKFGRYWDLHMMSILRSEWDEQNA